MRPNTGQQQQRPFCALDNKLLPASLKTNHLLTTSPYLQQGLAPPAPATSQSASQSTATNSHLQANHSQQHQQHHHQPPAGYHHHHPHHPHHHHQHQPPPQHHPHHLPQQPQPTSLQHNHVVPHGNIPHPHAANHMWPSPHGNSACYPPCQGSPAQLGNASGNHMSLQTRVQYPPHGRHYQHGPPSAAAHQTLHPHQTPHQQHHLHHGPGQGPTPGAGPFNSGPPPPSQGGGDRIPLSPPNYAKLPPLSAVNQQRINECAGIPLISTATAHLTPGQRQRISRKQSHSPPGKNWPANMAANASPSYAAAQFATAHVQGAPIMISKQQNPGEYWAGHNFKHRPTIGSSTNQAGPLLYKQLDKIRIPLRYQSSAPAGLSSCRSKENLELQLNQPSKDVVENSTFSSSNGGDSCNSNETCLPRIIKPRKRRKKDRKPPCGLVNATVYMKMDAKLNGDKAANNASIKAYKSSEDLQKCLQKFSQISNLSEEKSPQQNEKLNCDLKTESKDSVFKLQPRPTKCQQNAGSLAQDLNHGICFCSECDPLRSLWDYPLRRSLSDSSSTSSTSGTGSLSDNNVANELVTSPSGTSQESSIWPKTRADIVGVIGSKRVNKESLAKSLDQENEAPNQCRNGLNLYNNILGGINLSGDLFKTCSTFGGTSPLTLADETPLILLPETAETLLTRSINEISKKLIETCSNEAAEMSLSSCNSLSSFSTTTSCSSSTSNSSANSSCCAGDFSNDSGIESAHINGGDDLVFNFDHLHIAAATGTTMKATPSSSPSSNSNSNIVSTSCSSTPSSSPCSSSSLCGSGNNSSTSSSPTDKFSKSTNFLTSTSESATFMQQPPSTPSSPCSSNKKCAAPTLESFLVDLNNNQIPAMTKTATTTATSLETFDKSQQQQQFNALTSTPRQTSLQQHQHQLQRQHEQQQFFNNCYDLMWQQQAHHHQQQQLVNHNDQLSSSSAVAVAATTTTNTAMSSFLDSVGSLKTVFSTIS